LAQALAIQVMAKRIGSKTSSLVYSGLEMNIPLQTNGKQWIHPSAD
jgi:hypothetical protein